MTTAVAFRDRENRSTRVRAKYMTTILYGAGAFIAISLGMLSAKAEAGRLVFAISVCTFLILTGLRTPRFLFLLGTVWLVALGLVRRLATEVFQSSGSVDALLLVGPAILFVLALISSRIRPVTWTPLTRGVLLLTVALIASALNPAQGDLTVGLAGVLLVVVPLFAFWIGRSLLDDPTFAGLLRLVALLSLFAAAYGLFQIFIGFPSWDEHWIRENGYAALSVGGFVRPFSSFSSVAEFATFLAIGTVVWLTVPAVRRRPVKVVATLTVLAALGVVAVRTASVLLIVACALILAVRMRLRAVRAVALVLVLLFLVPIIVGFLVPRGDGDSAASTFATHQVSGLSQPLAEQSTLPEHVDQMVTGLKFGLSNPVGIGVGSVTIGANKFGGRFAPTEVDPSDAAVTAGLLGFATYSFVAIVGVYYAYQVARARRDNLSLAALAILIITSLHWLSGGHYAVAPLTWAAIGWVDRSRSELPHSGASPVASAPTP